VASLGIIAPFIYDDFLLYATGLLPALLICFAIFSSVQTKYKIKNGYLTKWDEGFKSGKYINGFDNREKKMLAIKDINRIDTIRHLGIAIGLKIWISEHEQDAINIRLKKHEALKSSLENAKRMEVK